MAPRKAGTTAAPKKTRQSKAAAQETVTPVTTTGKTEIDTAAVEAAEAAETAKAEKEEPVKKETVKKESTKIAKKETTAKAELQSEVHIQFGGKAYSQEDLMNIAKDVWKYDLKQEAEDLTSVELYVKPEEHMAYYVMNKEFTGSFYI